MKKVLVLLAFIAFAVVSCSPENNVNDDQLTDPEKVCPPGQPNC